MELLSKVKAGYAGFMSSLSEIGSLNIEYMEKTAARQMASSKMVTDMGFEQLKSLSKIDSVEAVKSVPSTVLELSTKLAKSSMEESKAYMEQGASYKSELMGIIKKKDVAA